MHLCNAALALPTSNFRAGSTDCGPILIQAAPIIKLQLAQNVRYVEFCGPFRDAKRTGNVFIG
jgi:hypothetical protein